ncbi:hypothetical protein EV356DRAFT_536031 [Viridothelium virens]|uniref:Ricin B lectin domain-containing protein n=1 Tax=Viridothelium virens TaxID=1048519 RepID=A0A6A6GYY3_VIRVR|nr:hypothetical protein EV356DRAFT_536031 [Viridothelium virens]
MVQFDSNIWYQITEARVGFGSGLASWSQNKTGFQAWNITNEAQYWQILAYSDESSTYAFRSRTSGPSIALATVYDSDEVDPSYTQPRTVPLNPDDDSQKWTFGNWSDGSNTLFIVNVANGSAYHLDVHPGNPVFMSSQTAAQPNDPGQHWEIQTIAPINDVEWSTTLSSTPTMRTTASASNTGAAMASTVTPSASGSGVTAAPNTEASNASSAVGTASSSHLSTGAAVGIGVGVGAVVVILLAVGLYLFFRRRTRRIKKQPLQISAPIRSSEFGRSSWRPVHEVSSEQEKVELPNNEWKPVELPTSYYQKREND